jgi:hypothetical protein
VQRYLNLDDLTKIQDRNAFIIRAREISNIAIQEKNIYLVYKLAVILDERGYGVSRLEKYICQSRNPFFILRFAKDIMRANITRLQNAIIRLGDAVNVAKFGCFVRGANKELLEDIVIKSKNAKAAYMFLKFYKDAKIQRLKHIILKSKKPRYLFLLACKLNNQKEIDLIQDIIIESNSNTYVRLLAKHVRLADLVKLENRIIETQDVTELKRFARSVPNCPRIKNLLLLI